MYVYRKQSKALSYQNIKMCKIKQIIKKFFKEIVYFTLFCKDYVFEVL